MDKKQKLDAILKTFESYIREQDYFEIVYSPQMGYLRLPMECLDREAVALDTPEKMMGFLCSDVISDVVYSPDNPKRSDDDSLLTAYEKAESRRRLIAILETMDTGKERCAKLAEKYIKKYEGGRETE